MINFMALNTKEALVYFKQVWCLSQFLTGFVKVPIGFPEPLHFRVLQL